MLAAGLAVALLVVISVLVANDVAPLEGGLESSWGIPLVGFVMEIGVVLCLACLWAPKSLRHTRPLFLWKTIAVPLLLVYGAYVVLLLLTQAVAVLPADNTGVQNRPYPCRHVSTCPAKLYRHTAVPATKGPTEH